jgi:hypothetical protein
VYTETNFLFKQVKHFVHLLFKQKLRVQKTVTCGHRRDILCSCAQTAALAVNWTAAQFVTAFYGS